MLISPLPATEATSAKRVGVLVMRCSIKVLIGSKREPNKLVMYSVTNFAFL